MHGFTLIELLTVIVTISILSAILFSVINKVRESSNITQCLGNLRQIGIGYSLYLQENDGKFPPYWDYPNPSRLNAIAPYLDMKMWGSPSGVLSCPTGYPYLERTYAQKDQRMSYHQNRHWPSLENSATKQNTVLSFEAPQKSILVYESWGAADATPLNPDTHGSARNILYVDMHVESSKELISRAKLMAALSQE